MPTLIVHRTAELETVLCLEVGAISADYVYMDMKARGDIESVRNVLAVDLCEVGLADRHGAHLYSGLGPRLMANVEGARHLCRVPILIDITAILINDKQLNRLD